MQMLQEGQNSFRFHAMQSRFTPVLQYDGDNAWKLSTTYHQKNIAVSSQSVGPAGLQSVSFEGPQALLRAIGLRAHLNSTPDDAFWDICKWSDKLYNHYYTLFCVTISFFMNLLHLDLQKRIVNIELELSHYKV